MTMPTSRPKIDHPQSTTAQASQSVRNLVRPAAAAAAAAAAGLAAKERIERGWSSHGGSRNALTSMTAILLALPPARWRWNCMRFELGGAQRDRFHGRVYEAICVCRATSTVTMPFSACLRRKHQDDARVSLYALPVWRSCSFA